MDKKCVMANTLWDDIMAEIEENHDKLPFPIDIGKILSLDLIALLERIEGRNYVRPMLDDAIAWLSWYDEATAND